MYTYYTRERQLAYVASSPVQGEIGRGGLLRELHLRLRQAPTVTAVANTAAGVQRGGGWGVIRRLELILDGGETLISLPGSALPFLAGHWSGHFPRLNPQLGDATTANPLLDETVVIPFLQPFASKPIDTVLDLRRRRLVELRVTWGTHLNVHSGATAYTTAPTLDIGALRSAPLDSDVAPDAVFTEWRRTLLEVPAPVTAAAQRVELSTGYMYRGAIFETLDAGDQESDVLNALRIRSGSTTFLEALASAMRESARQRYGIQVGAASAVYSRGQNDLDAWYLWDHVTDGRLQEAIDTMAFSEFFAELDVVGGANVVVNVYPTLLVPARR
jgi:hypothetical protein